MNDQKRSSLTDEFKIKLLLEPWTPENSYQFKKDAQSQGQSRAIQKEWLDISLYSSWLVYSKRLKGALCHHCVLFRPRVHRGVQSSFITRAVQKYKNFHSIAKSHVISQWHREAPEATSNFISVLTKERQNIYEQIDSVYHNLIQSNRKTLYSISIIVLCRTQDLALRGIDSKGISTSFFTSG